MTILRTRNHSIRMICGLALAGLTTFGWGNPLQTTLQDFEGGSTGGVVAVAAANSPATTASNTTIANVIEGGSRRLRLQDSDGGVNGAYITLTNAIPQSGYYLFTADVKVDNPGGITSYGMAVVEGGPTTTEISDVNAGYVMNLTGTGDAALGYQTIGAAINVPSGGSFPRSVTIYFGTDVSSNTFNAAAADGDFNGRHRSTAATWPSGTSNAVYIDNLKRIGPGNFGEERHLWISLGDGYTDLVKLDSMLVQAKNNNFNCIDILARYRADAYYIPNRTDATYANPEPLGVKVGGVPVSPSNDPLQYAIDRGRELGLKIYISFGAFMVSDLSTPYPSYLPSGSIQWFYNGGSPRAMITSDPSAEGLWADPGRADVREYTRSVLLDVVKNYDIDGVIFDRIRYPSFNYSYNPQALSEMGVSGTPTPTNVAFRTARRDVITNFLRDAYTAVTDLKPWVVVGTSPIAYAESMVDTYNSVMQYWPGWQSTQSINRTVGFGICDLYQAQFYRLWNSTNFEAPGSNTRLMQKAQFGDVASFSFDFGLSPGAYTAISPIFYHPNGGDVNQSNANAQNITDGRALAMSGFGLFAATRSLQDINLIRAPGASSAGVDVLANAVPTTDYLFKQDYDNIKPNAVGSFNAAPQADGTVVLSWNTPAPAADGESADNYLIYRSTTAPVKEYWANLITTAKVPGTATSLVAPTSFAGSYYYRIVPVDDYNNRGPATQIGPFSVAGEPVSPADVIVDNPQATITGTWTGATGATDKYGADYRFKGVGTGAASVAFNANIPVSGTYRLHEWHPAGSNRATNARHTVVHTDGSNLVTVDQRTNGGKWNLMGQYSFTAGGAASVTIDDVFTGTVVMADAIRWEYVVQAPAAPSGLSATAISSTAIQLTWTDIASTERNYIVARSNTAGGPFTDIATIGINHTSYTDSGLSPETTRYYRVRAVNSGGVSANSNTANATTLPLPPAAPSGLAATAASSSQINLTWTDNSNNETNFIVSRATSSGGPYSDIASLSANATSYSNTGLSAGTTYYYRVRATNAGGASANSNTANATTLPNPPAAPSGLSASAASSSQINLSWSDNSNNETNFIVSRATSSGGPYSDIATLGANVTSYSNTGLAASTTYYYRVRASNAGGESVNSNTANATTAASAPAAPSNLVAAPFSFSRIDLTWTDNSNNETNFVVRRATSAGGTYSTIATLGANITSYSNTGLAQNTTYYYIVTATNAVGSSPNSNIASATTLGQVPATPSNVMATAINASRIDLTWTDLSGIETNMVVKRSTSSSGPFATIATLPANTTSYSNTGLAANTRYYYVVAATNASGSSPDSASVNALTWPAEIIVDNSHGGFSASSNWSTATSAADKYGTNYRFRATAAVSDQATWNYTADQTRNYQVYAWWSQGSNRSKTAPYSITRTGGTSSVNVNQQTNGGSWRSLGTYSMTAGANNVRLSCWTTSGFVVIADAVRIVPR